MRIWESDRVLNPDLTSMTAGNLFLVGATHRTAPLGLRERLALTPEREAALAAELATLPGLVEFVLLSTCNRFEIYGVAETPGMATQVAAAFCRRQGFALAEFARIGIELSDRAVIQHLLEVSSGLDSQMLGENEIFGQVKKAFLSAQTRGSTGPVLNRLFQKAFQATKHVRSTTAITSGLVSVANVALDQAIQVFGELKQARVLLLGAGDIGLKSGRAFRSRGPASITVASRRLERAQEVAAELGANAVEFDHALATLADFDVVVCSTSAPGTVVSVAAVSTAMAQRAGRPILFVDVALPRDVEADVAALPNVFVSNLDDLAKVASENRLARQGEIAKCQEILRQRADDLWTQAGNAMRSGAAPERFPTFADSVALYPREAIIGIAV